MAQRGNSVCEGVPCVEKASEKDESLFHGRFRVMHPLKQGLGVATMLGQDEATGALVVLKVASEEHLSPGAQLRLEHEAQVLRELRSPWIAPLVAMGRQRDRVFLVMPFLPGVTLEKRLQGGPLSVADALTVSKCLMAALQEAHGHGVLHRDLKPANVIVDEAAPLQGATVIDFGLARSIHLDSALRDQPVGTARYLAPEQAGLLDQEVDERSDLYSAGVLLFECLAGRPPFLADSVGEVLRQHLTERPPDLRGLGIAVPRALDEVIQRLLRKEPRDRYQSANAVLADLTEILRDWERGVTDPPLVVGLHDRRQTLTEPAFVGRATQVAALETQLQRAADGQDGLVFLEAESGGGKTRLLQELTQRAAHRGMWTLSGQGVDQVGLRPFQPLLGVVQGLAKAARDDAALAQDLRTRLGDQVEAACAALPELADVLRVSASDQLGPESFGQVRSLEALTTLLDALGSPEEPALILLDDCQWADELTLKLIGYWFRRRGEGSAGRHLMLVVAFRSEEVSAQHYLRGLQPTLHLSLPAFGTEDVRLLAESMAGPLPSEALDVVQRFAEGSPFMAAAVLQGLVESQALVAGPAGWAVEPQAMAHVQSSRHAAAFLAHRITLLPAETLCLLSVGAVLGKEFGLDLAAKLAGQTPSGALIALDEARRRHIIWTMAQDTQCCFIHDKIRQTLLERLPTAQRQALHLQAALVLEKVASPCVFSLAYHFDAAGESRRALPHALAAADQARAQHSLEIAAQQYGIAERGAGLEDGPLRDRIAEGLGDVLMLLGRYEEARQEYAKLSLAPDSAVRARVEGKLGELAFKRGDIETAMACYERGLKLVGKRVPRWSITFGVLAVWEILVQTLHTLLPRYFLARRKLEGAETDLLIIRLYSRLAYAYWFERGRICCLWAHLREMNLAELYPPTLELAQAYSEHAPVMTLIPYFRRGIAYAEKSLAIRKALGDVWGQGQSLHFHGVVLYASSRFSGCIEKCREAVRLLRRTGDYWEVNIARYQIAVSLYRLGDLRGALEEARGIHQSGLELGDGQASGISLDVWAWASGGKVAADSIRVELERPSKDVQRTAQVLVADGTRLLGENRPFEATAVFEKAWQVVRAADVRNAWVSPVLPWFATSLRRQLEALSDHTPKRRHQLLAQLRSVLRRARRIARSFQNELPHVLRESAYLAAYQGRLGGARKLFAASLKLAARQGAVYERAQTLMARGCIGLEAGWPGAAEDITQGEQLLAALAVPAEGANQNADAEQTTRTLSLADRFENVLLVGRRIASALTRDDVTAAVHDAGLRLLRGERCVVLDVTKEPSSDDIGVSSSLIDGAYTQAMVRRALANRRAVAFVDGLPDSTSESLLLAGIRSSLCAPIFVRGRAAACFFVTHRQVAKLFGETEERLADFIATLAGAALENAENFEELRRLNESLEQQIAERREAEKQVQDQAALLDKAQDAIKVVDLDDRILYWNQSAERLYGWTAAEAVGRKSQELLFAGIPPLLAEAHQALLTKGEWTGELKQITRAGERVIVESRWTLVRDDDGRPRSRLVVNTNITEKKKIETQFLRAQRMESIGTLAGGIAHDLNNMLVPIFMAVDLLKMPLPDADRNSMIGMIQTSAERGADMIRQILSFARGVEGQRVTIQLKHLIRDLEKVLNSTFPKSIAVEMQMPGDLWVVQGDATQIYQVLMNLCVNARDAMPQGGQLTIHADHQTLDHAAATKHLDARPGKFVVIHVADSGTGIPPEVLERVFDPFFTTKEIGKGTGLGLSTTLGIVKSHGGFVTVTTEVGKGSQFSIYLPAAESESRAEALANSAAAALGQGELILIVDDEAPIREVIKAVLGAKGYRVLEAREGQEALAVFDQHRDQVRLVITDMMMPGMDGAATIRALNQIAPDLPIVATSGLIDSVPSDARLTAFLPKPFTPADLEKVLRQVLSGARETASG